MKKQEKSGEENINFKIIEKIKIKGKKEKRFMGDVVPIDRRSRTVDSEEIDSEYHGDTEIE